MRQTRIAIACQGGGSQCAFVAGVLKSLFDQGIQHRFRIVGLSGTSGGAITAALAWVGLLAEAQGDPRSVGDRILACWKDLSAQSPQEILLDGVCIEFMRLAERGFLPTLASTPSSLAFRLWSQVASTFVGRPEFTDLRALLVKHLDFDGLPVTDPESPVLLVGAADILEGSFKVFSSTHREITIDALLASAAIPNLFPAVWVDGHAYWDGIFSSNPPIVPFLQRKFVETMPEEIWIVQVNRAAHQAVPERPGDIFDCRNHLAGNLSLQHELQVVQIVNTLLEEHALNDNFRTRVGLSPIEPIKVRFIRMSPELQDGLDYPSKLSRQRAHIDALVADGERQATSFLADLGAGGLAEVRSVHGSPVEGHGRPSDVVAAVVSELASGK